MAASGSSELQACIGMNENIPTFDYVDLNSKVFNIGAFGNLWRERLKRSYFSVKDTEEELENDEIIQEMEITSQTMVDLKRICSPDTLRSQADTGSVNTEVVPPEPKLQTLRLRKRRQDYKETLQRDMVCRQETYVSELESLAVRKRPCNPEFQVPEGEVILSFNILYPPMIQTFRHQRHHQTLNVLGSQKLSQLRDAICCVSDLQVSGEFSNTPDMAPEFISKDHYKSAFFFFEGIFYNDTRNPECRDLSKNIIDWSKTHDFPPFQTAKMEETVFNDLTVKIGYPYLYCHQGDCEHVVILTDVRLVHDNDCLDMNFYPLLTYKHRVMSRKCAVCHMYICRWLTTNDSLAPMDPCPFCEQCFRMLHYDKQGRKLGSFLAYPYVDAGAFN